jgi:hypothetical protein
MDESDNSPQQYRESKKENGNMRMKLLVLPLRRRSERGFCPRNQSKPTLTLPSQGGDWYRFARSQNVKKKYFSLEREFLSCSKRGLPNSWSSRKLEMSPIDSLLPRIDQLGQKV